jgi:hypothetical protein
VIRAGKSERDGLFVASGRVFGQISNGCRSGQEMLLLQEAPIDEKRFDN